MRQGTGKTLCKAENIGMGLRETNKRGDKYEACPESKDTEVLYVYNLFNLQKRHCE